MSFDDTDMKFLVPVPSQQPPPQSPNRTSNSITLSWGPPDYPNGPLVGYNIYRNGTLIANTSATGIGCVCLVVIIIQTA